MPCSRPIIHCLTILLLATSNALLADDISVLRLSQEQRAQLYDYLDNNMCTCGCGMTISQCLHDDPTCPVSPKLARAAVAQLLNQESGLSSSVHQHQHQHNEQASAPEGSTQRPTIYNYDGGGGGYVSDGECSYVSYGGVSFKSCD